MDEIIAKPEYPSCIKISQLRLIMKAYNRTAKELTESFEYIGRTHAFGDKIILYKFRDGK